MLPHQAMPRGAIKPSANHLRAWREFRGLTQAQLAELVDTSDNVISMLESGDRQLSPNWLRRLAPVLGTTPGFLLDHGPYDIPRVPRRDRAHSGGPKAPSLGDP
jgi:transcriptional regulator with XRE-family HTH domain